MQFTVKVQTADMPGCCVSEAFNRMSMVVGRMCTLGVVVVGVEVVVGVVVVVGHKLGQGLGRSCSNGEDKLVVEVGLEQQAVLGVLGVRVVLLVLGHHRVRLVQLDQLGRGLR